jgi:hypothetical protein
MRTISFQWRDEENAWEDRLLWGKVSEERLVGKRKGITESAEGRKYMCVKEAGAERGEGREYVFEGSHRRRGGDGKRKVRIKWRKGYGTRMERCMRAEGIDEKDEWRKYCT